MNTDSGHRPIIVGVDGSGHSSRALAWAVDEARLRGLAIKVIYAFPAMISLVGSTGHEYYPQVEMEAKQALERSLADMPDSTGLRVDRALIAGSPAKVLVDASRDASMLVVGSRGVGGFRGMVMGSVSLQCAQHAQCPVVVVRSTHQE